MPDVGTTDGVKDDVHALTREAVHFCHEVLMLVINWDTAQLGNCLRPSPLQSPEVHWVRRSG